MITDQPTSMDFISKNTKKYTDCTIDIERWRVWYGEEFYIYYTREELRKGKWSWGIKREIKHRWFVTIEDIDEHRYSEDLVSILDQLRHEQLQNNGAKNERDF